MLVTKTTWPCIAVALLFGCSVEYQTDMGQPVSLSSQEKTDSTVDSDNAKGAPGAPPSAPSASAPSPGGSPPSAPMVVPTTSSDKRDEQTRRLAVESMCTCTVVDKDNFDYGSAPSNNYRSYCRYNHYVIDLGGLRGADNFRCSCPNRSYYADEINTKGRAECLAGNRNLSTMWDCTGEETRKVDPAVLGKDNFTAECNWSGNPSYSCNCSVTPRVWGIELVIP